MRKEEPPKGPGLVSGRFLVTNKPNPFAHRNRMRHLKMLIFSILAIIVIGAITYGIWHVWGSGPPEMVDQ